MDNDDDVHTTFSGALDPKLMLAATTFLIAAGVGTWKAFSPSSILARHRREQDSDQSGNALKADNDSMTAAEKKKRARDRRKRTPLPKLPRGPSSATATLAGPLAAAKKVIRQPSGVSARKQRPRAMSVSEHSEAADSVVPEDVGDEISRPAGSSHNDQTNNENNDIIDSSASLDAVSRPENIALPASPEPIRSQSPPPPSPSASTSGSTSGTPHTPPSVATSQLSLPPLSNESSSWQWEPKNHKESPPQRGRKRSTRQTESPVSTPYTMTFPTLNTLPPPNTPLDAQIVFMKNQVDNFRSREEENRLREEALLHEMERLRMESEQSRQEVSRFQWQLNDMNQREERLLSQINALTAQMHAMQGRQGQPSSMPMPIAVPLYQPQPIPYAPLPVHLGFYHPHAHTGPYPNGSPMMGPISPTNLVSPTHLHPLMSIPIHPMPMPTSGTPTTPLETFRGGSRGSMRVNHSSTPITVPNAESTHDSNEDANISFGLMEAIFKRPESYTTSRSGSNKSARSPSASLSPPNSMGVRSINASRSPSVSGRQSSDNDGLHNVVTLALPPPASETIITETIQEENIDSPQVGGSISDGYFTVDINETEQRRQDDDTPEPKGVHSIVQDSNRSLASTSSIRILDIADDSTRERGQPVHVYY